MKIFKLSLMKGLILLPVRGLLRSSEVILILPYEAAAVATINAAVNCRTSNVVYCVNCTKPRCRQQYVGVSEFRTRMSAHRGYVGPKPKRNI